ncbi:carbohydrate kinase [Myriangium duriaei CBS 260.36]|uniref:Gluconokinase n=1 Tax=Myriangium duriaei CBS 260.36 TaxID=1168546 RepID=A0A9P4J6D3_9PEZI|nr:carbohydrate kinase [Myriangium duriaei CBS 260.36]
MILTPSAPQAQPSTHASMGSRDPISGASPSNASPYSITAPVLPSDTQSTEHLPPTQHKHIWFVTGPAGCGKTTSAAFLARTWGLPYLEGDTFHPPANIAKMAAGHPLTDDDRWSWLEKIGNAAVAAVTDNSLSTTSAPPQAVILTCSALKKSYREKLRSAAQAGGVKVHFLYLALSPEELVRRVTARKGHYMKAEMVRSQLEALEEPDAGERAADAVVVDAGRGFHEVEAEVREAFERVMGDDRV